MIALHEIVSDTEKLSIRCQCELLDISRGTLYYKPKEENQENLEVMLKMDEHYLKRPTAGVLRMQDFLFSIGFVVNEKRVRRLLRKMGLMAIYSKKNLSKLGQAKYIRHYLLRGLKIDHPNHVWAIDITYIPMKKGFLYLTAIIDVYSRFIVGWGISNSLDAQCSLDVLKQAIANYGTPEIINSDQGSQFTCNLWIEYLEREHVQCSMDGKGRAIDNIFIERFWKSLKYDHVYIKPANDGLDLYKGLQEYFDLYNNIYTHQGIGRNVPTNLYHGVVA